MGRLVGSNLLSKYYSSRALILAFSDICGLKHPSHGSLSRQHGKSFHVIAVPGAEAILPLKILFPPVDFR